MSKQRDEYLQALKAPEIAARVAAKHASEDEDSDYVDQSDIKKESRKAWAAMGKIEDAFKEIDEALLAMGLLLEEGGHEAEKHAKDIKGQAARFREIHKEFGQRSSLGYLGAMSRINRYLSPHHYEPDHDTHEDD